MMFVVLILIGFNIELVIGDVSEVDFVGVFIY